MDRITEQSILSAIWILSCTDKIPQMTYTGIKDRIVIPTNINLPKLVASKTELFRIGIPTAQLKKWKREMQAKTSRPTWIASSGNQDDAINEIKKEDVFRNRFRNSLDAKSVPIEILQWGLNHIDQMYDLEKEEKERRIKWITTILVPLLSLLLAFSSIYFSSRSNSEQRNLKKYELTLRPKHEGYTEFMKGLLNSFVASGKNDKHKMIKELDLMRSAFYKIQPFVSEEKSNEIWDRYLKFEEICFENIKNDSIVTNADDYVENRKYFQNELSKLLLYEE